MPWWAWLPYAALCVIVAARAPWYEWIPFAVGAAIVAKWVVPWGFVTMSWWSVVIFLAWPVLILLLALGQRDPYA